jgi:hypothetical protein
LSAIDHLLVPHFSGAPSAPLILSAAVLLGFRHATDPDDLAAVSDLIATGREAWRGGGAGPVVGRGARFILLAVGLPTGRVYPAPWRCSTRPTRPWRW